LIHETPFGQRIVGHAEVMPDRWRQIQPGLGVESVERHVCVAEHEPEVVLAARTDILPLRVTGAPIVADLDPAVLQQGIEPGAIPGDVARVGLQLVLLGELAIGQRHVERVLLWCEPCRPMAVAMPGIIHAAETGEPILVPVTLVIGDVGILGVGLLADPEHGCHGRLEIVERHSHRAGDPRSEHS